MALVWADIARERTLNRLAVARAGHYSWHTPVSYVRATVLVAVPLPAVLDTAIRYPFSHPGGEPTPDREPPGTEPTRPSVPSGDPAPTETPIESGPSR